MGHTAVAIRNEARGRMVATQLNTLAKTTGAPKVLADAAQTVARLFCSVSAFARVLSLPMGLEHLVDPAGRQRLIQRQVRHHCAGPLFLESLNDFLPDIQLLDRTEIPMQSAAWRIKLERPLKGMPLSAPAAATKVRPPPMPRSTGGRC